MGPVGNGTPTLSSTAMIESNDSCRPIWVYREARLVRRVPFDGSPESASRYMRSEPAKSRVSARATASEFAAS